MGETTIKNSITGVLKGTGEVPVRIIGRFCERHRGRNCIADHGKQKGLIRKNVSNRGNLL